MDQKVILVTGGAGFLGSAIVVDLARRCRVVAVDCREPSADLLRAAPGASWRRIDIADAEAVDSVFRRAKESHGRVDFVVHLAAFYHFGTDWHRQYERTNVQGTSHVLDAAARSGVRRVIFASSIAAMEPAPPGEVLTEKSPTSEYIPYARSKAVGERMVRRASDRLPAVVLRIAGAFSDWAELPPLSSLIRRWSGRSPLSRLIPGRGTSGMPYIHRDDVVRVVRRCIAGDQSLDRYEVLLASCDGAVLHKDLFPIIHGGGVGAPAAGPIFLAPGLAKVGLRASLAIGYLTGNLPNERPWMLQYVNRPWVVDTTYTRGKLGWSPTEGMGILDRLPMMLEHYRHDRRTWEHRNRLRDKRQYEYYGAAGARTDHALEQ